MADADAAAMRVDRFLWWARLAKTRAFAQALAERGHLRIDGRAAARAAAPVRIGNVLTFATHRGDVRVIRVAALPLRRGPPAEAAACYQELASPVRPELVEGHPAPDPPGRFSTSSGRTDEDHPANDSQQTAGR